MKIVKVYNNNVVNSLDEKNREVIILGKGIGFKKHEGDLVDESLIEKIFRLPNEAMMQFEKLVDEIPYEYVKYTDEVVKYATDKLKEKLNKNIYITLTDHLQFAIERSKQHISYHNVLLWEIKKFYQNEYEIGKKAIEIIREKEGIKLPDDEAGFIALHIVNAETSGDIHQITNMPVMLKDILSIVEYSFQIELDQDSFAYGRFVTHLKFLIQRVLHNECYPIDDQSEVFTSFQEKAKKEYACAKKIRKYMKEKTGIDISDEEMTYLTVHISRIIRRSQMG